MASADTRADAAAAAAVRHSTRTSNAEGSDVPLPPLAPVVTRFYAEFVKHLVAHHTHHSGNTVEHPQTEDAADAEGAALRRPSPGQSDALRQLLWQWLLLLHATTQQHQQQQQQPQRVCSAAAAAAMARGRPRTPWQVEQIFQRGFSSLIPATLTASGVPRLSTTEFTAPWHDVGSSGTAVKHTAASPSSVYAVRRDHSFLTCALTRLSDNGPLFSSWCALCFVCVAALSGSHKDKPADARAAMAGVRDAWDASVRVFLRTRATRGTSKSREVDSDATRLDASAVEHLWRDVYARCAAGGPAEAMRVDGVVSPPPPAHTPHPLFWVWISQWYIECCRVAAHGRDDGFDVQAVPLFVVARVAQHLHQQLEEALAMSEENGGGMRRTASDTPHPHPCSTSALFLSATDAPPPGVSHERVRDDTKDAAGSAAAASARHPLPLTVATLTGLALQAPAVAATNASAAALAGATASGPATSRHHGHHTVQRKRRRGRQDNADTLTEEEEEDSDAEMDVYDVDADADAYGWSHPSLRSSGGGGGGRTALQRFLATREQLYEVSVAAGLLTTYTLVPTVADDTGSAEEDAPRSALPAVEGGTGAHFSSVHVEREVYLRSGEVQWWTLGDAQRHRQLMTDKRT